MAIRKGEKPTGIYFVPVLVLVFLVEKQGIFMLVVD